MARVEKLLIQGIRSFGPEDEDKQIITFQSPLTLILGQNGCGKTTIIESLKYCVTGDLPPGCRLGQSFVHDPKIARQPEIRGKLQLQVQDLKGETVVATRVVQVTQKVKKIEFKTLDATLTRRGPDGQAVQTSGRCIDMDSEMCNSMGVTKAILNNVIFCHQEEADWPLDEGKKLKERFDAIFDATKHNKCLEHFRKLRKDVMAEVKLLDVDLSHLKDKKEEADRKRESLTDAERRMSMLQDQMDGLNDRRGPIDTRLREIIAREADIHTLNSERDSKKMQLDGVREQQASLRAKIHTVFGGSTDELAEAIATFDLDLQAKKSDLVNSERKLQQLAAEEARVAAAAGREQTRVGQLELEERQQQARVEARNRSLADLVQALGMPDIEDSLVSEAMVVAAMGRVDSKARDLVDGLEKLRRDHEGQEQQLRNKVDTLRDNKVKLEQEIAMKKNDAEKNQSEAWKVQSEIEEADRSAGRLAVVERQLSDVQRELDDTLARVNADELKETIKTDLEKRRSLEDRLEGLAKEVQLLHVHSSTSTEIGMQKDLRAVKEAEIRRLKNKNGDTLRHLLNSIPDRGVKEELQLCLDRLARDIQDMNVRLGRRQREVSMLEAGRKHKKERLDACERELKALEDQVYDRCGHRDLEDVIKDLADSIKKLQDQKGILSSQEQLSRQYVQKLQEEDPCCPLCHRNFLRRDEAMDLVEELNGEVRNVPTRLRANNEKLERLVKEYDGLLQLRPAHESIVRLRDSDLPKLKAELVALEKQLDGERQQAEELQAAILVPQADEDMAKAVQGDVVLLEQSQTELRRLDREVERLQARLPDSVSARSLDDTLSEQEQLRAEVSAVRRSLDTTQEELSSHTEAVQKMRERKNVLVEEQLKIEGSGQRRRQLEERLAELQAMEALASEEVETLKEQFAAALNSLADTTKAWSDLKTKNREHLESERAQVSNMQKRTEEVRKWQADILDCKKRGVAEKLEATREALATLERERCVVKEKQRALGERVDELKDSLARQQVHERDLKDNLELRERQRQDTELVQQLAKLEERIGGLRFDTMLTEKRKLILEDEKLCKEIAQAEGRIGELQQKAVELRGELANAIYKQAEKNYILKMCTMKVKKCGAADLQRYYIAMEWAMMHFHRERMKVINNIVHDLWRSIYRGNDIDYIQIKTNESEMPADTDKRRRSYDYRVVQIKSGIEIDMKGRCSAGQKVLACLVIRIALAETLSTHCGILALDEPTTNLDQENIKSLSGALIEIVNNRMMNKGFQLIVITHDEEFLDRLTRVDQLKYYYRVSRNGEGKSVIKRHAVER